MNNANPDCPKLPWMIEFFSTREEGVLNNQIVAAFANNNLDHLSKLTIKSTPPVFRATQLICTITPSTTCSAIEDMLSVGMTVAKISVPGHEIDGIRDLVAKIRVMVDAYSRKIGRVYPLAIAVDVAGPEIRTGKIENNGDSIYLPKGKITTLTTDEAYEEFVTEDMIFVDYQKLPEVVQPGDKVLLDNGRLHLSALEVAESIVRCIVEKAGTFISHSSIIIPNAPIELPTISKDDKELIAIAIEMKLDFIMVSGIHNQDSVREIRKIFGEDGNKLQLISNIDNIVALDNIDQIIESSDAVCMDSERLLIDIPKEKLFIAQKSILAKCALANKPAICTTDIINPQSLSKSEVCDIANTVIDGVDALIIGSDACRKDTLKDLGQVCREAESALFQKQVFTELIFSTPTPTESLYSLCISTVGASLKSQAAAIICLTASGRTPKVISKYRPRCPIIAITRYPRIARIMRIYKGIEPIIYLKSFDGNYERDVEGRLQLGITYGKHRGFIRMGDAVVTVAGSKRNSGMPNCMKVLYASDYDTLLSKTKY